MKVRESAELQLGRKSDKDKDKEKKYIQKRKRNEHLQSKEGVYNG